MTPASKVPPAAHKVLQSLSLIALHRRVCQAAKIDTIGPALAINCPACLELPWTFPVPPCEQQVSSLNAKICLPWISGQWLSWCKLWRCSDGRVHSCQVLPSLIHSCAVITAFRKDVLTQSFLLPAESHQSNTCLLNLGHVSDSPAGTATLGNSFVDPAAGWSRP